MDTPLATYRLQLSRSLPLSRARELVPYLAGLGVSHIYLSPIWASRAGSEHGYDVIDHSRINPEYGTPEDLAALSAALMERNMGLLLDIVPNHMCIADSENQLWQDVLENGQAAEATAFFDIDWGPPKAELHGKVLLPVLGGQFGRELEQGKFAIKCVQGAFVLFEGGQRFPLTPPSWRAVLEPLLARVRLRAGDEAFAAVELESVLRALLHWPAHARARRHERDSISRRIEELRKLPDVGAELEIVLHDLNGRAGEPESFDALERLVSEQHYRLSHWRVAAHEINYRRFFDVNDLAAIRVESKDVFRQVHALCADWLAAGLIAGLRIDHVDGLLEPETYLARVRELAGGRAPLIVVEKILAAGEALPETWPVEGTTGYEHLAAVSGVLVDADNAGRVREVWRELSCQPNGFRDIAYACKRLILETALASELTVLSKKLDAVSEQHRYSRDFTLASLQDNLREVIACFPVYRTYITADTISVPDRDARAIGTALAEAARRNPLTNRSVFDFIEDVLMLRAPEGLAPEALTARSDFVLRFQQLTGPVMAKGVEDTAFYRYFPLPSLAEVGCDPDRLGISVDEFHVINRMRAEARPRGLSASATHDTKRGEDARARLAVLSEIPGVWRDAVIRWRSLNEGHRIQAGGRQWPDEVTELFIYQALVGGWPGGGLGADPSFSDRLRGMARKAIAEAKVHTSWVNPDDAYNSAVDTFVTSIVDPARSDAFLTDFIGFMAGIQSAATGNALSQLLLKIACPGIPDIYQGCELWDHAFTDPDNRRVVDFELRQRLFEQVQGPDEGGADLAWRLLQDPDDAQIKMFVLHRALLARRKGRVAFESRKYEGCAVKGTRARHALGFARGDAGARVIAVVGRLYMPFANEGLLPVGQAWGDTRLLVPEVSPHARFREALTGRFVAPETVDGNAGFALADVLSHLPVALIEEMA